MIEGEELRKHFKGYNFMTPYIIKFGEHKGSVFEISVGDGIFTPKMYGLTISETKNEAGMESQCFTEIEDLENYIKSF